MTLPAPLLSCGLLVINERGELLVGHSTGSPRWDLPKGLLDAGETPIECARREGQEEFGLAFAPTRLVDLGAWPSPPPWVKYGMVSTEMRVRVPIPAILSWVKYGVRQNYASGKVSDPCSPSSSASFVRRVMCRTGPS